MVQLTVTVVTAPATTVPAPPLTTQFWGGPPGWVLTATSNGFPLATFFENVAVTEVPTAAVTARSSPPLFVRTRPLPARPATVTVIGYSFVVHATFTSVTSADAVPLPPVTTHVCAGPVGWVLAFTSNVAPLATFFGKTKLALDFEIAIVSPLFSRTSPSPSSPVTEPPIENVAAGPASMSGAPVSGLPVSGAPASLSTGSTPVTSIPHPATPASAPATRASEATRAPFLIMLSTLRGPASDQQRASAPTEKKDPPCRSFALADDVAVGRYGKRTTGAP